MDALNEVHGETFQCIHSSNLCKYIVFIESAYVCKYLEMNDVVATDPSAGDASDYYTELGAQFAFLVELRENVGGSSVNECLKNETLVNVFFQGYGFELPADQIIPSGEEMWAAYEVILDKLITLK